ncbi:hypothetical protein FA10DRAFT_280162 [Acaromyces ingoldii]|uniref:Ricin B lectin domain-containing protein n=1 Tax=Acaromyces ingoldii TaxID=215250 RepID=A0A316YIM6_9BASI|nr:hypothetical protein FA10DRAFT_280162 [Acaromyces ingoldii]PWN89031.1 hypothetical protein FA10DRAFT_280162 [Acaromyces ingoldii]
MLFSAFFLGLVATTSALPLEPRSAPALQCSTEVMRSGPLNYGDPQYGSTLGQLGLFTVDGEQRVVEAYSDTTPLRVAQIQCNSTYLNFSKSSTFGTDTPVRLVLEDDHTQCLGLKVADGQSKTFITVQDCDPTDDEGQAKQIWSDAWKFNYLLPMGGKKPGYPFSLVRNTAPPPQAISAIPNCDDCDNSVSFTF